MPQYSTKCSDRKALGAWGEQVVADWLELHGYTIMQRNFACKYGEIDLIARKNEVVAFVEVKRRKHNYFALSEVVTPGKQRRIACAAKYYIALHGSQTDVYRFDVALVEELGGQCTVAHIEQAFVVSSYD